MGKKRGPGAPGRPKRRGPMVKCQRCRGDGFVRKRGNVGICGHCGGRGRVRQGG